MSKKKKNLMNEEEIKNKIILPYLESLGLTLDEIKFEEPTYIKPIDRERKGRSDILCKSGKDNLFLIEVKAESKKITDKVIEQGICYARLMQQIPPFMIATNGKETKVYDVIRFKDITGKRIGEVSDYWTSGLKISHAEEMEFRYQAVKKFIGYSRENLKIFSLSQTQDRMESLKGNRTNLNKKYIPELFLARKDLTDTFNEFLDSEFPLFAIIGESGVGKTNYICDLTERFSENFITIFFNSTLLSGKIFENIQDDFNWFFSPNLTEIQIIKRLDDMAKSARSKVIIFVDAIDEVPSKNFNVEFNDFVNRIRSFNNIKICISCKSSVWVEFLNIRGTNTCLVLSLYPPEKYYIRDFEKPGKNKTEIKNLKFNLQGYPILGFVDDELDVLNNKYKKFFKYKGSFQGNMRRECKLGFMLRVVAEVYKDKQIPNAVNETNLLVQYLEKKKEKIEKRNLVENYLYNLGNLLVENEMSDKGERGSPFLVNEIDFRKSLQLSANEELLPDLFYYNILYRRKNLKGGNSIGFYYAPIRDFVISNYVLKLHKMNKNEFKQTIPKLLNGPVCQNALRWHIYITDSTEHKRLLMERYESRALSFLTEYVKIIDEKFPSLKSKFEPYTSDRIGIVVSLSSDVYGFRPLKSEDVDVVEFLSSEEKGVQELLKFISLGVQKAKFRSKSFKSENPRDSAIKEIKEQFFKIVKNGILNEEKNTSLAIEKIIAILYYYGDKIGFTLRNHKSHFPRKPIFLSLNKRLFPIDLQDILKKAKAFLFRTFYEEQEKRKYFSAKYTKDARIREFDDKLLDKEKITRKAEDAVEKNIDIPRLSIHGDFPPYEVLIEAIRTVQKKQNNIEVYYLPTPSLDSKEKEEERLEYNLNPLVGSFTDNIVLSLYSKKQLKRYIEEFFEKFIEEYRIIVKNNFSAFSKKFKLYSIQPIHFRIETEQKGDYINLNFGYKKSLKKDDIFEVEIESKSSRLFCDNSEFKNILGYLSIGCIFPPYSGVPVPLDKRYNTRNANEECILRAWVYKYIKEELKEIIDSRAFWD